MSIRRFAMAAAALSLGAPALFFASSAPAASAPGAISTTAPCGALPASSAPATFSHVVLIIFENKPVTKIVGDTTDAPYLNSLINACSYSKNDKSLSNTSLANYVALTSGYTGCSAATAAGVCTTEKLITSNSPPATWPQASKSIFELMGSDAREWSESEPSNCPVTDTSAAFAINHSPYPYYTRTQPGSSDPICPLYDLPFPSDLSTMASAKFNLVTPNKIDIMHKNGTQTTNQLIQNGDNWAKGAIPQLLASANYQSGNTAILITWDEGNATQPLVPLIAITPYTQVGGVSTVAYNHYSVLKGIQQMVGFATPLLGHAGDAGVNSIRDDAAFGLKPGGSTQTLPGAPSGFTVTGSASANTLNWTAPSDGGSPITGYKIYRGTTSGGETLLDSPSGTSTTYSDTTAVSGQQYFYQVSAVNAIGEGARSAEQSVGGSTTTVPAAPVLSGTANSGLQNSLSWTVPNDGGSPITAYIVIRNGAFLKSVSATTTSYVDSAVTAGTLYKYQVKAQNAIGKSPASNKVLLTAAP
ncbi:MAG: phosphatidylinositol-3-phosphatase [Nocardioidaceae bacterium]|nr:phosphatidylinositol-3-phosphatase [Nocardioidaceae bacterium]